MKKRFLFTVFTAFILLFTGCEEYSLKEDNSFVYDRVLIIGIDGAGGFIKNANTPEFDSIVSKNCAYGFDFKCENPSSSAPNWGSILHGVIPEKHQCNNTIIPFIRYSHTEYPSIFKIARNVYPNAKLASVCNWAPINYGLIEENAYADKFPDQRFLSSALNDKQVKDKVIEYINENDPKIMFIQFDSVDEAGHSCSYGANSPQYLQAIETVDSYVGEIFKAYTDKWGTDSTLLIITADHGGINHGHGGSTDAETNITIAIKGKTVNTNCQMSINPRDLAAIALDALGIKTPSAMDGKVPANLFLN